MKTKRIFTILAKNEISNIAGKGNMLIASFGTEKNTIQTRLFENEANTVRCNSFSSNIFNFFKLIFHHCATTANWLYHLKLVNFFSLSVLLSRTSFFGIVYRQKGKLQLGFSTFFTSFIFKLFKCKCHPFGATRNTVISAKTLVL